MHTVLGSDAGDPAFSPEEPSQEALSLLTATVDEDIERIFTRLPEDEAPGADRRPRPGRARAPGPAGAVGVGGPRDPHARRLPPRPDPVHAARLGDPRLRGRAGAAASRAAPEALAAARRGGHAALVRVRRPRRRDLARPATVPEGFEQRARDDVPRALPRARRPYAAACRRGGDRRTCCRSTSSRRRSTSCATSSTTVPTGSRFRSRGSAVCWRRSDPRRHPELDRSVRREHANPHSILGAHPTTAAW